MNLRDHPGGFLVFMQASFTPFFFNACQHSDSTSLTLLSDYRRFFFAKFDGERDLEELQLSVVPSKAIKLNSYEDSDKIGSFDTKLEEKRDVSRDTSIDNTKV